MKLPSMNLAAAASFHSDPRAKQDPRNQRNNTLNMALKRMGFDGRMCGHGFRSFALTNIQEKLKVELRVVDRQLAHVEKSKVMAAYNRAEYLDERTEMMQSWADLMTKQGLIS